jgi:hypothetical protein
MDEWDDEYIDMEEDAYIRIKKDGTGEFQFGLVKGDIDGRIEKRNDNARLEFTWSGFDEDDEISGRGWAEINKKEINGRIFIHLGDDSGFKAKKK